MQNVRSMKNQTRMSIILMIVLCAVSAQAGLETETYSFMGITHNNMANTGIGQDQLSVVVSGELSQVTFKFVNAGPAECVITEIYFQDGSNSLFGFVSVDEALPGVDFKQEDIGAVSPKNLPGGKSIDPQFIATACFSIEPVNPEPAWGINPEEWVAITYSLQSKPAPGKIYEDIIQELNDGTLRIGIHVQGFDDGGSESFITPEPGTMALLAFGGLILRKRRKV